MQADGEPAHELMHDIKEVDWLPLDAALARLSRGSERAFLANVGPIALQAAATAETARRSRAKAVAPEKRRSRRATPAPVIAPPSVPAPTPSIAEEMPVATVPDVVEATPEVAEVVHDQGAPVDRTMVETGVPEIEAVESEIAESEAVESEAVEFEPSDADATACSEDFQMVPQSTEQPPDTAADAPAEPEASDAADSGAGRTDQGERVSLVRKVRDWLTRAA
jgi:8-oxo-dGTP diphosphatase